MKNVAIYRKLKKQIIVTRPDYFRIPDWKLPFYPRSTGLTVFGQGDIEAYPGTDKPFVQINWCVAGQGTVLADGNTEKFRPGDVLIQMPYDPRRNCAEEDSWSIRWLTFDGPEAESFMKSYGYARYIPGSGQCPEELFSRLEDGFRENTIMAMRRNIAVICEILGMAGGLRENGSENVSLIREFIAMAQENIGDSSVNLNILCDRLGVHRSTLSRAFTHQMLISPGKYLLQIRIQHALYLLRSTVLPVAEVARQSGIPDPANFARLIRAATGSTPLRFRREP